MFTSRSSIDSETLAYRFLPRGGGHRGEVANYIAIEKTSFLRRATSRQQATGKFTTSRLGSRENYGKVTGNWSNGIWA